MRFRSLATGALLSVFILIVAAPPPFAALPTERSHTSDRFGFSTFREESGRMTVFADGYPASVAPNSSYIPIPIAVAMTRPGKTARFRPESFTLIDADGHAVSAATYGEMTKKYDRLTFDRSLLNERPMAIAETITDLKQVPSTPRADAERAPPKSSSPRAHGLPTSFISRGHRRACTE
jgi:hypothetical protein